MSDPAGTVRIETLPDLSQIARALGCELRWGGQTTAPWSVLHHLMAGHRTLVQAEEVAPAVELAWLMHDAEEAITGDIRWGQKTPAQQDHGKALRRRIYWEVLEVPYLDPEGVGLVRYLDSQMARAEADVLCHPRVRDELEADFTNRPDPKLVEIVWELKDSLLWELKEEWEWSVSNILHHSKGSLPGVWPDGTLEAA